MLSEIRKQITLEDATEYTSVSASYETKKTFAGALVVPTGELWELVAIDFERQIMGSITSVGGSKLLVNELDACEWFTNAPAVYTWQYDRERNPTTVPFFEAGSYDIKIQLKMASANTMYSKDHKIKMGFSRYAV
ncbi:unnamed protein product [marine sediment metagenome]|uniref:Uncharacterized protein n=1 Tax=marine sediment metagenome TaxID=412755 RepID=X1JIT6_9ZZZZ